MNQRSSGQVVKVRRASTAQLTLSSQPPTARNIPEGCHATIRIPNPGSTSGVNVPSTSPANDSMYSLYCDGDGGLGRHPSNHRARSGINMDSPPSGLPIWPSDCPWVKGREMTCRTLVGDNAKAKIVRSGCHWCCENTREGKSSNSLVRVCTPHLRRIRLSYLLICGAQQVQSNDRRV